MKRFMKRYHTIGLIGLITLATSSCSDWLTIYPQDRVVEENFWEDKNDLEGVRYGAYRQLASSVAKLALWGDLRSDTYEENSSIQDDISTHNTYVQITRGLPDSSMTVFDWGEIYTCINYCNKVLENGAAVLARDKQFTSAEWSQIQAEMTALRALSYFYLIRAFKDVPYTTKVISRDSEVESFPQINQLVVLDSIIADCERVKDKMRPRYSSTRDSKGLLTKCAVYAMLADMYLWRGALHEGRHGTNGTDIVNGEEVSHNVNNDYKKAEEYADRSLYELYAQNKDEETSMGGRTSSYLLKTINFTNGPQYCDLIENTSFDNAKTSTPVLTAHNAIFKTKNSRESIFELQYSQSDGIKNTIVNSLFGYGRGTHLRINYQALGRAYEGEISGDGNRGGKWDSRIWVGCQKLLTTSGSTTADNQPYYYCMKYHVPSLSSQNYLNMKGENESHEIESLSYTSTEYNNWIVYRLTDVLLMKAEAIACQTPFSSARKKEVTTICNAIHIRSFCDYQGAKDAVNKDPSKDGDYPGNSYSTPLTAGETGNESTIADEYFMRIMNERQIELIGEGKRWFDLVRFAERISYKGKSTDGEDPREKGVNDGQTGVALMVEGFLKAGSNSSLATTLKNRIKNRYGLYNPVYYMEVRASNGAIEQNPVWNKSKYEQ